MAVIACDLTFGNCFSACAKLSSWVTCNHKQSLGKISMEIMLWWGLLRVLGSKMMVFG